MCLKGFAEYGLGRTQIYRTIKYCPSGNLYVKMEGTNPLGSIKDRTAYYIFKDLIETGRLKPNINLVESSSGNLGLALAYFASELHVRFMCLVDPTLPPTRLDYLKDHGVEVCVVSPDENLDYREARIQRAYEFDQCPDWIWTNQYDNPANFRAHFETTGPEIWSQMGGRVDFFVCSTGTGGTLCGTGHYLKQQNKNIKVVAVEPKGSTIFGGVPGKYLTAGSGMLHPSGIFNKYGDITDYYCKVDDRNSIRECLNIQMAENLSVGITTGSVLVVGSYLASSNPDKNVVIIAPDGGNNYKEYFNSILPLENNPQNLDIFEFRRI